MRGILASALAVACLGDARKPPRARDDADVPVVVFVVLDTVRSQSLSLCGYERPTSPYLEKLAARETASHACHAYAPGSWTVPSHASYFTGLDVPTHGVSQEGHRLAEDAPVLAEQMAARGYRTVYVAANPTMSNKSGLHRGFEVVDVGHSLNDMRGAEVGRRVASALRRIPARDSLFLFVNILDAHDPYAAIPNGVGWVEPQPRVSLEIHEEKSQYRDFLAGTLDPEGAAAYARSVHDAYDYGVYLADEALDRVMRGLRQSNRLERGYRLVVTSDHGEYVGERGLLRHGCDTWEPVVRVPVVFFDSRRSAPLELPEPFSALNVNTLVRDGALPDPLHAPVSYSKGRPSDVRHCRDMTSTWDAPTEKLSWRAGERFRTDLATDPGEARRDPLPDGHPRRAVLDRAAEALQAHVEATAKQPLDEGFRQDLRALGYVE